MLNSQTVDFLKHLFRAYPARTAFMTVLLVLSGLAEGIGLISLLPMVEVAMGTASDQSALTRAVNQMLYAVGLEPTLGLLLGLIVATMIVKGVMIWLAQQQVGYAVAQVATDLRLQLLRALMRARWSYFSSLPAGHLTNAVSTEARRTSWAYRRACDGLASAIQLLVYVVVAFLVSWPVALIALGVGGGLLVCLQRFVATSRAAGQEQTRVMKSLMARLTEALSALKPVRAMGREAGLWPVMEQEAESYNQARRRDVWSKAFMRSFREPLFVLAMAAGLYALLTVGEMAFATVAVLATLFYRAMVTLGTLQLHYQAMTTQESAFHSIQEEIRSAEEAREASSGRQPAPLLRRKLTLRNISCAHVGDEPLVLDDVSLSILAGTFVVFVGPSGAGKTTLADLLVGLLRPQQGDVFVDGVALEEIDLSDWRHQVGYVPQSAPLFHASVFQNVALGDDMERGFVQECLEAASAWSFVRAFPDGLDHTVGERGAQLSGGQRQRISIARALARRPRLLILDEATTALDPPTEQAICGTLRHLRGDVTIISISHQPAMRAAADQVFEVKERTVRKSAKHSTATNIN